jgi:cis-3-alkyl-4-acyloxetan-2-one decarboxylase
MPDAKSILAETYPFTSRYLDIDGQRMHYVDEGEGPLVVCAHGNPTWSFYYRELIKGLKDRCRVVAMDHIGCGLSDKPQDYPYTLSTHARNFGRLMDHLDAKDVTIVCHDWGGPISLSWAVNHPDRVARVAVCNTAAFFGGVMPFSIRCCRWPIFGAIAVRGLNLFALAAVAKASMKPERMSGDVKRGYLLPYDSYANRVAVHRFVQDIPLSRGSASYDATVDLEQKLPALADKPMVIFWGEKDFCFTTRYLDQWIERFPNATVHRFPDAGHYVVEDAHERMLPVLRDFVGA